MPGRHIAVRGVGTAGLATYCEARKRTDSVALFDGGSLGTACARGLHAAQAFDGGRRRPPREHSRRRPCGAQRTRKEHDRYVEGMVDVIRLRDTNTASHDASATISLVLVRAAIRDRIEDTARPRPTPIAQIGKVCELLLQAT